MNNLLVSNEAIVFVRLHVIKARLSFKLLPSEKEKIKEGKKVEKRIGHVICPNFRDNGIERKKVRRRERDKKIQR